MTNHQKRCTIKECNEKHMAKGLCRKHYQKQYMPSYFKRPEPHKKLIKAVAKWQKENRNKRNFYRRKMYRAKHPIAEVMLY